MRITFFCILTILCLAACNTVGIDKAKLHGKWNMETIVAAGDTVYARQIGSPIVAISQGGDYIINFAGVEEKGVWSIDGNTLTLLDTTIENAEEKKLSVETLTDSKLVYITGEGEMQSTVLLTK